MSILVDTCIWSKVLRYKEPDLNLSNKLIELIKNSKVSIIGPIRQEVLSGITHKDQFNKLKTKLSAFEDIPIETHHYIQAAEYSNFCRSKGIQGSSIDFLICSVAKDLDLTIFTLDKDFFHYKKILKFKLMK